MLNQASPPQFIHHLHAFRAIAMLTIVAAHAWPLIMSFPNGIAQRPDLLPLYALFEMLFHGSTLYFALISGLLYRLVLRDRGYGAFFKSKLTNVVLPYCLVSLVTVAVFWSYHYEQAILNEHTTNFVLVYLKSLVFGKAMFHLWYIPVLVMLFLSTPLIDSLLKSPNSLWVVVIIALLPMVIGRTGYPQLLSWQSLTYFFAAYALGMLIGDYYQPFRRVLAKYTYSLWIALVLLCLLVYHQIYTQSEPVGVFSLKQAAVYLQKITFACLLLHYLGLRKESTPKVLDLIARHSYSLYLLHASFSLIMAKIMMDAQLIDYSMISVLIAGAVFYIVSIALSLLISVSAKRMAGSYSRMIVGT